jgi:hypothetical protein
MASDDIVNDEEMMRVEDLKRLVLDASDRLMRSAANGRGNRR